MNITYIGHATVLLEESGTALLTDPMLRPRVVHLRRYAPAPRIADARRADAVLISHVHYDHLDLPSLRALPAPRTLVGPVGLRRLALPLGAAVSELRPGDRVQVGALGVRATHAEHVARRLPWQRRLDALGFVVEGRCRVYFAGDTDLFEGMRELGPVDVALVPIWGWGRTLGGGSHLDPARAAEAAARIRPAVVVPIHWGTYFPIHLGVARRPDFVDHPPLEFAAAMKEAAPDVDLRVLRPGESLDL